MALTEKFYALISYESGPGKGEPRSTYGEAQRDIEKVADEDGFQFGVVEKRFVPAGT